MTTDSIEKQCTTCKETKKIEAFLWRVESKTYRGQCRDCCNKRIGYRRQTQTPAFQRATKLRLSYGITPEDYDRLFAEQDGKCALCKTPSDWRPRRGLRIDHCHVTGVIRGLLCDSCNSALGRLGDTVDGLTKALNYLIRAETHGLRPTIEKRKMVVTWREKIVVGSKQKNALVTEDEVRQMRLAYESGVSQAKLAQEYNMSPSNVSAIVNRMSWRHVE